MRRHIFVEADLYVSLELLCVRESNKYLLTLGKIYRVITVNRGTEWWWPYRIEDDMDVNHWSLGDLNAEGVLYPLNLLTEQDLFMFKLSGRLPE